MNEQIKIKINKEYKNLFPELAESLEKEGQLQDVLLDEDGFPIDGYKKILLCGLEQLRSRTVKDAKATGYGLLSKEQRNIVLRGLHQLLLKKGLGSSEIVDRLAKRYGIHRATVYRILYPKENVVANATTSRKPQNLVIEELKRENANLKKELELCQKNFKYVMEELMKLRGESNAGN
ncbi:MAG: hypothetical protein ACPLKS_08180 [Caldisericum exile]|uniref:hypothetical protein n=1 Tax=Caldisericum exile TaxID=693075 RepID=UPI003C71A0E3